MIVATIYTRRQRVSAFHVTGHAGTAPAGQDLVCAAASGIVQAAILGIRRAGGPKEVVLEEGNVRWQSDGQGKAERQQGILIAMWIGLQTLAKEHPNAVEVQEVRLSRYDAGAAR